MKPTISYRKDLLRRLKEPRYAAAYLNRCLEDEDEGAFLLALRDVAEAHGGIRPLAKEQTSIARIFSGCSQERGIRIFTFSGA